MSVFHVIIGVLLFLIIVVAVCLAAVWLQKRIPGKAHDERQERFRCHAFRLSFAVGLFYYGFVTVLLMAQQKQGYTIDPYLLVFGGIILQVFVFRTYCVITQSFMILSKKPAGMLVSDLILGIISLQCYRWCDRWDLLEEMGYPASFKWIFLILTVFFFFYAFGWSCHLLWLRLYGQKE